jgi:hypothetical protein
MSNLQWLVSVSLGITFIETLIICVVTRKKKQDAGVTVKVNSNGEIQIPQGIDEGKITNNDSDCWAEECTGSMRYNQLTKSAKGGIPIELNLIECIDYERPHIDLAELLKINRIRYQEESSESSLMAVLLNSEQFKKNKYKKNIKK